MTKRFLGPLNALYPMPTVLVGAMVEGRPNYLAAAHVGILDVSGTIMVGLHRSHLTTTAIKQQGAFSLCVPGEELLEKVDWAGIYSGHKVDKSKMFTHRIGGLTGVPLIEECPVVMECRLVQTLEWPQHDVFIGQIVSTEAEDSVMTDEHIDLAKLKPILFSMYQRDYWGLGPRLGQAWSVGKNAASSAT